MQCGRCLAIIDGKKLWGSCLVVLVLMVSGAIALPVQVAGDARTVNISIVRRVEVPYYVITKARPLEFEATGPAWLRIYTRAWWPQGKTGDIHIKLALWQDDVERPIQFDMPASSSSFGPGRRPLSAWRSFFIQVPAGANRYRLALEEGPTDTVGVRIVEQQPRAWEEVPISDGQALTLIEGADTSRFFAIAKGIPQPVAIDGPCRVRVRVRLGFEPSMDGAQSFVLTVSQRGRQLARRSFRTTRSLAAAFRERPGVVPAVERTLQFNLSEGRQQLELLLSGTLARTAGVRVERLTGEKYE